MANVVHAHGEPVAAEAGERVLGRDDRAQTLRYRVEQPVARPVAERVVDDLEVVEVDEEHRDATGLLRAPLQSGTQLLDELLPAEEPRERVVARLPGNRLFRGATLGDVDAMRDPEGRRLIGARHQRVPPERPTARAVLADEPALDLAEVAPRPRIAAAVVVGSQRVERLPTSSSSPWPDSAS